MSMQAAASSPQRIRDDSVLVLETKSSLVRHWRVPAKVVMNPAATNHRAARHLGGTSVIWSGQCSPFTASLLVTRPSGSHGRFIR